MSDKNDLETKILFEGAKGSIEPEEANAMLKVLSGAPLLTEVPSGVDKTLGKDHIHQTLDVNGNVLVSGDNYMFHDQKIKVLKEEFGAGNMLDTYMRLHYLDSSLENKFFVVEAKYQNGVLKGAVYQSPFIPIEKND